MNGVRLRPRNLATKAEVAAVFTVAKERKIRRRYDLPVERPVITLSELVEERVRDLNLKNDRHRRIKTICEMFRDSVAGDPPVDSITSKDILDYKRARVASSKLKSGSVNVELVYVGQLLRGAGKYFPSLATWKAPPVPYVPVTGRANRLTAADIWELQPLVGMRTSELRLMERRWEDLRAALVRLPARVTKKKRGRDVPLNGDALAMLRRRLESDSRSRFVFPGAAGANAINESCLYRSLRAAAVRVGLSYGQHAAGGFRLYDARHTAATRMLQSGADTGSVADVLGNTKEVMLAV